ncbi:conserved hypothetical protein [Gammaproteobacteria bacterium]
MMLISAIKKKFSKISSAQKNWKYNPWVLAWLGLFLVVLMVNLGFIILSVHSNPGLVVQDYYEQGRDYERHVLERIAARNTLQWEIRPNVPKELFTNLPFLYEIQVRDSSGKPLEHAKVQVHVYRPSDSTADFTVFLPEVAPGQYRGEITLSRKGIWELLAKIEHGSDVDERTHRVNVLEK